MAPATRSLQRDPRVEQRKRRGDHRVDRSFGQQSEALWKVSSERVQWGLCGRSADAVNRALRDVLTSREFRTFVIAPNRDDLLLPKELVEAGEARPVIERRYALSEVGEALRHVGDGHAQGQTVIRIAGE